MLRSSTLLVTALGMNVLCEPLGRQIVADTALFRLAIHHGGGSGELKAQSQIVDEARDLLVRATARSRAGDDVRQCRRDLEVDPLAQSPTLAFADLRHCKIL